MASQHQIFWTLVGCWAWLLCKSGLTTAIPVTWSQTTPMETFPVDTFPWGLEGDYYDATTLVMTTETTVGTTTTTPVPSPTTKQFAPLPQTTSGEKQTLNSTPEVRPVEALRAAQHNTSSTNSSLDTKETEPTTEEAKAIPPDSRPRTTEPVKDTYSGVTSPPLPAEGGTEKILAAPLRKPTDPTDSTIPPPSADATTADSKAILPSEGPAAIPPDSQPQTTETIKDAYSGVTDPPLLGGPEEIFAAPLRKPTDPTDSTIPPPSADATTVDSKAMLPSEGPAAIPPDSQPQTTDTIKDTYSGVTDTPLPEGTEKIFAAPLRKPTDPTESTIPPPSAEARTVDSKDILPSEGPAAIPPDSQPETTDTVKDTYSSVTDLPLPGGPEEIFAAPLRKPTDPTESTIPPPSAEARTVDSKDSLPSEGPAAIPPDSQLQTTDTVKDTYSGVTDTPLPEGTEKILAAPLRKPTDPMDSTIPPPSADATTVDSKAILPSEGPAAIPPDSQPPTTDTVKDTYSGVTDTPLPEGTEKILAAPLRKPTDPTDSTIPPPSADARTVDSKAILPSEGPAAIPPDSQPQTTDTVKDTYSGVTDTPLPEGTEKILAAPLRKPTDPTDSTIPPPSADATTADSKAILPSEGPAAIPPDSQPQTTDAVKDTYSGVTDLPLPTAQGAEEIFAAPLRKPTDPTDSTIPPPSADAATADSKAILPSEGPAAIPTDSQPQTTDAIKDTYSGVTDLPLPTAGGAEEIFAAPLKKPADPTDSTIPPPSADAATADSKAIFPSEGPAAIPPDSQPQTTDAIKDTYSGVTDSPLPEGTEKIFAAPLRKPTDPIDSTIPPPSADATTSSASVKTIADSGLHPTVDPRGDTTGAHSGPSVGTQEPSGYSSTITEHSPTDSGKLLVEEAGATPVDGLLGGGGVTAKEEPPSGDLLMPLALSPGRPMAGVPPETSPGDSSLSPPSGSLLPPTGEEALPSDNQPSPPLDSTSPGAHTVVPAASPDPNQPLPVAALRPGPSTVPEAKEPGASSGSAGKEPASDASATESQLPFPSAADSQGSPPSADDEAAAGTGEASSSPGQGSPSSSPAGEEITDSGTGPSKDLQPSVDGTAAEGGSDGSSSTCEENAGESPDPSANGKGPGGFGNGRACHSSLAAESAGSGPAGGQQPPPSAEKEPPVGSGAFEEGSEVSSSLNGKQTPLDPSVVEPEISDTSASEEVAEIFGKEESPQLSEGNAGPVPVDGGVSPAPPGDNGNGDDLETNGNQGTQPGDPGTAGPVASDLTKESGGTSGAGGKETSSGQATPEPQLPETSTGETSGDLDNGKPSSSSGGAETSGPETTDNGESRASPNGAPEGGSKPEGPNAANANDDPLANPDMGMLSPGTPMGETPGDLGNGGPSDSFADASYLRSGAFTEGSQGSSAANGVPSELQFPGASMGETPGDLGNGGPSDSFADASYLRSGAFAEGSQGSNAANGVPSELQFTGAPMGETPGDLGNGGPSDSSTGVASAGPDKADSTAASDASLFRSGTSTFPEGSDVSSTTNTNGGPLGDSDAGMLSSGRSEGKVLGDLSNGSPFDYPTGVEKSGSETAHSEGPPTASADASTFESGAQGSSTAKDASSPSSDMVLEYPEGLAGSSDGMGRSGPETADNGASQTSPADASAFKSSAPVAPEESSGPGAANADLQYPGTSVGETPGGLVDGGASSSPGGVARSGPETADSRASQTSPADASAFKSRASVVPVEPSAGNDESSALSANSGAAMQSPGTSTGETSEGLGKGKSSGVQGKGGKSSKGKGAGDAGSADQKASPSALGSPDSKKAKPASNPDTPSPSANKPAAEAGKGDKTRASPPGEPGPRPASSGVDQPAREPPRTASKPSDQKPSSSSKNSKTDKPAPISPAKAGQARSAPLPAPSGAGASLFPYGPKAKDKEYVERKKDFNSPVFRPEIGIPLGKTLYNCLCYTDNGQILLLASDKNIPSYPDPPPRGFNGREKQPMVAVFWQNADFSGGRGTTFYQEYITHKYATHPVVTEVEKKIRQHMGTSFSARWTLKVTWVNVVPYPAQSQHGTNTYQAIITTNGYISYVLFLYQRGGMLWDYTKLASTNVLIGYTSGDGYFRNDDLIYRTPAEKYRPDRWEGHNTDVKGLWIYQLDSRVRMNYKQMCLDWVYHESDPSTWNAGLPSCPCTLERALSDKRFTRSKAGISRKTCCVPWDPDSERDTTSIHGVPTSSITLMSSSTPNKHGSGVRCLYGADKMFLEGRQERIWRNIRKTGAIHDEELKFYDWCCNRAGDPRFCDKYGQKRPKISCNGQKPSGRERTAASRRETSSSSESEELE